MGHNIEKAEKGENASVFVVGEPAWHRLGKVLEEPATAEEAIKLANLDFKVIKCPLFTDFSSNSSLFYQEVKKHFATVRTDTNAILGVVGKQYTIIQNKDAFNFFDPLVGKGAAIYHSAGVLGEGERVWVMAKLPNYIKVSEDDKVELYVILTNCHDGTGSLLALLSPVRVVCQNTLNSAIANNRGLVSVRHTVNANQHIQEAHRILGIMVDQSKLLEAAFKKLKRIEINSMIENQFIEYCIPSNNENNPSPITVKNRFALSKAINTAPGQDLKSARGTAWGLFNGYTHYLDYITPAKDYSHKQQNIWFGDYNVSKSKALEFLLN